MVRDCILIGLGQIGMGYDLELEGEFILTHAKAISQHQKFNLVAGVDPSEKLRKKFSAKYKVPALKTIKEAFISNDASVIIIATPSNTHGKILDIVLKYQNPELILCEKPLDYDLDEANKILKKCHQRNILLFVNYMRRSDIGALKVKRLINESIIETPLKGFVWYTKGLMNNGSHFLNLLEYWLGPINKMNVLSEGHLWNQADQEYDFLARFDLGEVIFCACSEQSATYNSLELIGPSGRLSYSNGGEQISWHPIVPDPVLKDEFRLSTEPTIIPSSMNQYQYNVYQEIANALDGIDYNLSSGRDALSTLKHIHSLGEHDE